MGPAHPHNPIKCSPITKTVGGSILALTSFIGAVCCYYKQRSDTEKIKQFELNKIDEVNIKNYIHQLRKLESSREFYKNFTVVLGVLTLASTGAAVWGGIELCSNQTPPNPPTQAHPDDLPLGQMVEVLPGEFVMAHEDGSYTVDTRQKTFRIPEKEHGLLGLMLGSSKTWLCYAEKILLAHSEAIQFDPRIALSANPTWLSSLAKETSRTLKKIKLNEPLNRKDKFLFKHIGELDCHFEIDLRTRALTSQRT